MFLFLKEKIYLKIVLFLFSLSVVLCAILLEFFLIDKDFILSQKNTIEVKKGYNMYLLSEKLYEQGVISCKRCFLWTGVALFKLHLFSLKEGEYDIVNRRLSTFFDQIQSSKTKKYALKITEGLTRKQIKDVIESANFLSGEISASTLNNWREGFFMPDTYFLDKNFNRDAVVLMGIEKMKSFLSEVWAKRSVNLYLRSQEDLLTLASIVEAETPLSSERQMVAGVYINRLRQGIPLCADPVLVYQETDKKTCGRYKLYYKHLRKRHEYNVYINKGLPPSAICNPSRESIFAASSPSETDNLYFVATGSGGHFFSDTFDAHKENIKIYKQNLENKK